MRYYLRFLPEKEVRPVPSKKSGPSKRMLLFIALILAVFLFFLDMIATWDLMKQANTFITRDLIGSADPKVQTATSIALGKIEGAHANASQFLHKVIEAEVHLRTASNKHTILVVSIAAAFALITIGFCLFVMGAEGAFEFQGQAAEQGNLLLKATSPGLLCFVLAAIVIWVALTRQTSIEFEPISTYPDSLPVTGATGPQAEENELSPLPVIKPLLEETPIPLQDKAGEALTPSPKENIDDTKNG